MEISFILTHHDHHRHRHHFIVRRGLRVAGASVSRAILGDGALAKNLHLSSLEAGLRVQ